MNRNILDVLQIIFLHLSVDVLWKLKNVWENKNPALWRDLPMQISLNSKRLYWFLTTVVMAETEWKIWLSSLYA